MTKLAVITGAASGIGAATTELFMLKGWKVIAVDKLERAKAPSEATYKRVDLADSGEITGLVKELAGEHEALDALVNNAALQLYRPILETSMEEWDRIHSVNSRAIFELSRLAYPLLSRASGAIVNVSSVHALATSIKLAAYAASKGSVLALTRAMAMEFAEGGVRVNAVLPGAIDTEMLREGLDRGHLPGEELDEKLEALGSRVVLGRVGTPHEIAHAILFLSDSERSSYITGASLAVDGGATARLSTE